MVDRNVGQLGFLSTFFAYRGKDIEDMVILHTAWEKRSLHLLLNRTKWKSINNEYDLQGLKCLHIKIHMFWKSLAYESNHLKLNALMAQHDLDLGMI